MAYNPNNPNGQAAMASSQPVVIASNQSTIKTKLSSDIAPTTGTITTATSIVTALDLSGIGSVTISAYGAAHAGVNITFEVFDSVNWVGIPAQLMNSINPAVQLVSGVLASNSTVAWNISPLLGWTQIRVRATAWTSGTLNIIIDPSAQTTQYLVNVATMPTTPVTGTVTITNPAGTALVLVSAATTNATLVKAAAGSLFELTIFNPTATAAYVKLYNKATAPVVGTDVPLQTIIAPATSATALPVAIDYGQVGKRFALGIGVGVTAGATAVDAVASVAGIQISGTYI